MGNDWQTRLYGNRGRRPIRPALIGGSNILQIVEGTYIDANNDVDHSADDPIYAGNSYSGNPLQWIALKFPQRITMRGVAFLAVSFGSHCGISLMTDASGPEIEVYQDNEVFPITDWGGLTPSTLRWSNKGTLTLGSALADPVTSHAYLSTGIAAGTLQYLLSGYRNSGADVVPLSHGGIVLNSGVSTVSMEGLIIKADISWVNVFISGGDIYGAIFMDNPNSGLPMNCGFIYNPA